MRASRVKYVCQHKVLKRVRLKRVLNPRVWHDASSYLRVELEDLVEPDADAHYPEEERMLCEAFSRVIRIQNDTKVCERG